MLRASLARPRLRYANCTGVRCLLLYVPPSPQRTAPLWRKRPSAASFALQWSWKEEEATISFERLLAVRVALCDDNQAYAEAAALALRGFAEQRHLDLFLSLFASPGELLACDKLSSFDVVFMDIEFGGKPVGIDAVACINERAPLCQVVYLTNYIQYSVDVYRTDHVWFIVKSQFAQRLPEVFDKLSRIREEQRSFIVVSLKGGGTASVSCHDIVYIERRKRITLVVTKSGVCEIPDKLSDVMEKLPEPSFARCHNSYVANMSHVSRIGASEVEFDNGVVAPISRRFAKSFRDRYFDWADQWTV